MLFSISSTLLLHTTRGKYNQALLLSALKRSSLRSMMSTNSNDDTTTTTTTPPPTTTPPATADLCDAFVPSPKRLSIAEPGHLHDYGGIKSFYGPIETIRCFESNPLVRQTLSEPGNKRVLVVDGGGSKRVAILGDELAKLACLNDWVGIIVNGYIRDSKIIGTLDVGVKALGTNPLKSIKEYEGERGVCVTFAGLEFVPGQWLYADEDGVIISQNELSLPSQSKL